MHFIEICTVLALLTYVTSSPVKDLYPDLEEIDRTVCTGTFSDEKLKAQWRIVRRHFIKRSNTTETPEHSTPSASASETSATITESAESSASSEEITESITSESSQESSTGATPRTRTTFSPLKVHYDDYNYPYLVP